MNQIEIIGVIAGFFSTLAPATQVIKTYKTKEAEDVSVLMFISFLLGNILWCVYGYLLGSFSVVLWNSLGILGNVFAIYLKKKYSGK